MTSRQYQRAIIPLLVIAAVLTLVLAITGQI